MYTQEQIDEFIKELIGLDLLEPDDDLLGKHGVGGDDFKELIEAYETQFKVNMDGYLWYFHTDEEGFNVGAFFFTPPYDRVQRIPVTPAMLLNFANQGRWNIEYPEHQLPKYRYDLMMGQLLVVILAIILFTCSEK